MNASPFQKRIMAVLAILCMLTLIFPTAYYLKYVAFDFPREEKIAGANGLLGGSNLNVAAVRDESRLDFDDVRWYMANASAGDTGTRLWAVEKLRDLCQLPHAQVFHWMECLNAKTTLLRVAQTDPNPLIVTAARQALDAVGEHGVMFRR